MINITKDTTYGELKSAEEFSAFKDFLVVHDMMSEEELDKTTIEQSGGDQTENVIEGLKYLQKLALSDLKISFDIWSDEEKKADPEKKRTNLLYFPGKPYGPYIVICAGGAYMAVVNALEAFPAAKRANDLGYTAFVLTYRVTKKPLIPHPQEDLAKTINFIDEHSDYFKLLKGEYAVCGFSAGGHLAASFGTSTLGYRMYGVAKPTALLLAYAATTIHGFKKDDPAAKLFFSVILGDNFTDEMADKVSVECIADQSFPPSFIMHGLKDDTVPCVSSEILARKLKELGVSHVLKEYPDCAHGFGQGKKSSADGWFDEACDFFENELNKKNLTVSV